MRGSTAALAGLLVPVLAAAAAARSAAPRPIPRLEGESDLEAPLGHALVLELAPDDLVVAGVNVVKLRLP